ncbi:uncharacterized protein [Lolium perenne]|uniref:uncharacterized protein n=1 Tax=Lolium perenne TaxID=4522 RepID=UPI0021F6399C|nr:uncharacterized protein LOC127315574 [Lolium perenne]
MKPSRGFWVSAEPVQKRGPGRPRKYPKVLASGHPQEHPVAEEVLLHPVAGEELQKPKAEAVLKRPRGRPPKVRDAEASVVQMSASTAMVVSPLGQHKVKETEEHPVAEEVLLHPVAGEELQKRPRGRPPKPKAEAVLKRPRGRPPKVRDAEASVVQMSASTAMVVSPLGQHKVKETEVIINTTHQLIVCCFNN